MRFCKKNSKKYKFLSNFWVNSQIFCNFAAGKETNNEMQQNTLHIGDGLLEIDHPLVMGIINVTPDSFACRCTSITEAGVLTAAAQALNEGADILDIGGCSTRPGYEPVSEEEEWRRVRIGLDAIRKQWPEAIVSVDTFRASVARKSVEEFGANIINDISGGDLDADMFATVADLRVPYIITHAREVGDRDVISEVVGVLQEKADALHRLGVRDLIVDPGFGFGKTLEQNYELLRKLRYLKALELPILVGVSRKSMIHRALGITPGEALGGTIALNTLALENGAAILRVHDVKEAKQLTTIYSYYHGRS